MSEYSLWGLGDCIDKLSIANIKIAILEADLRKGKELSNEEAGILAKKIRKINDTERVPAKNALNEIFKHYPELRVFWGLTVRNIKWEAKK